LTCYTEDATGKRHDQNPIYIGSCSVISGNVSINLDMDFDSANPGSEPKYSDIGLLLDDRAVSHWVITVEGGEIWGQDSTGPEEPDCWQVYDDEYDARDQAVIEYWQDNRMSRRQAVKHVTRLMKAVVASAKLGRMHHRR
jgi:hypothetical protein